VGVAKYKIVFSGVGKKDDEIREALQYDILMINLESEEEMSRVEQIAKELNLKARISIRVNPNIDAKTHPYISTGLHENKFGVDIETAKRLFIRAKKSDFLDPIGVHFHIGSQIGTIEPFEEASKIVADFTRSLLSLKIDIRFFDIGGGVGIRYTDEKTVDIKEYAQAILKSLSGLDVTIACEPGRILVGNSGVFLTKVLYEKQNKSRRFVIVDGAMNDLIRPALYGATHDFELLKSDDRHKSLADIVGPVCESGDFFFKSVEIAKTRRDDLLVIKGAGAYCFSMSSNYNSRGRVAEVAITDGRDWLIRTRESFEDMIKNEIQCI
jgi:diaminopimelate decarboxylase